MTDTPDIPDNVVALGGTEPAAVKMADTLIEAIDALDIDAHQSCGLFVIMIDDCGVPSILATTDLHASEVVGACTTVATATSMIIMGLQDDE